MMRGIGTWLGALGVFALALLGAGWLGHSEGVSEERARWESRQITAERAARQTEVDLNGIAAQSAARAAKKEELFNERVQTLDAAWRAAMADLPRCRLPARIGLQLNAAAGVPAAAAVAEPPRANPDAVALDTVIDLADTLDTVRANYAICHIDIERLTEARSWYEELRGRVNRGE